MKIGTVIASRGDAQLEQTVRSILASCPHVQPLVVDDSDFGLPASIPCEVVRFGQRLGCARGRHVGSRHFLSMNGSRPDGVAFTDDHMAFLPDDPRVPAAWLQGPMAPIPGGFERLATVGLTRNCITYAGCNGHSSATLDVRKGIHTVPRCVWDRSYAEPTQTKGMMGAMYFVPSEILERMGGWPALAGWIGWDEEMVCLMAWRMGIPVVWVPGVMSWHDFAGAPKRNNTYRYDRYQVSLASMWRLLLDDQHWPAVRKHLATDLVLECTSVPIPENVLAEVENPEMIAYAHDFHANFPQSDDDFIKKWLPGLDLGGVK